MASRHRTGPLQDSLAANPAVARLLTQLMTCGEIKQDGVVPDWYDHPKYANMFAKVAREKFRKRSKKLIENKVWYSK